MWKITSAAIDDYLALAHGEGTRERARECLAAWGDRVSATQEPREVAGLRTYRMGRPHKLRMVVTARDELVHVLPESEHGARPTVRIEMPAPPTGGPPGLEPSGPATMTPIRFTSSQRRWLDACAAEDGTSIAEYVRGLVDDDMREEE